MRARGGVQPILLGLSVFLGAGCTTTLDPTTLEPGAEVPSTGDPTTDEPATDEPAADVPTGTGGTPGGCDEPAGMAGSAFSSCADLPACTLVGTEGTLLLCSHKLAHDAAAHECELRGGYLAEVNSAEENLLIAEAAGVTGTNVWLGGRRDETFVWAWEVSGVVFWRGEEAGTPEAGVFVTWQPGEPNNESTVLDEPEKCLALTLGDVDWNDRACSILLPFLCEAD